MIFYYDEFIDSDSNLIIEELIFYIRKHTIGIQWIRGIGLYIFIDRQPIRFFRSWYEVKKFYG